MFGNAATRPPRINELKFSGTRHFVYSLFNDKFRKALGRYCSSVSSANMLKMSNENKVNFMLRNQMAYLNYVLKFFSLAPLNLGSPLGFVNFLYPICVVCMMIYILVRGLIKIHQEVYPLFSTVTFVAIHLQLFSLGMASCLSVISCVARHRIYSDAMEEFQKIDEILIRELDIDITGTTPTPTKYLFIHVLFLLFLVLIDYLLLIPTGPSYMFDYIIIFHIFFTVISIADCRVLALFRQLTHRFRRINHFFSKANDAKMFHTTFFVIPFCFTKTEIKNISKVHGKLITITENLNSYFSPHLLVEIASYFTISTCNAYNFFYVLTSPSSTSYHQLIVYYSAYWPIVVVIKLCILLQSCVTLTRQANTTSHVVQAVLINDDFPGAHKELDVLAQQLIHKKLNITACGFFPLDFSLLHAMISASTTYLIILIQFQISTDH